MSDVHIQKLDKLKFLLSNGYISEDEYNQKRVALVESYLETGDMNVSVRPPESPRVVHKSVEHSFNSPRTPSPTSSLIGSRKTAMLSPNRSRSPFSPSSPPRSPSQLLKKYPERNKFRVYLEHVRKLEESQNLPASYQALKIMCKDLYKSMPNTIEKLQQLNKRTKEKGFSNEFVVFSMIQIAYLSERYDRVLRFLNGYIPHLERGGYFKLKALCLFMRGFCLQRMRNTRGAVTCYEEVLTLEPTFYYALGNLGIVFFHLGNLAKGLDYLTRAMEFDIPNADRVEYLVCRSRIYKMQQKKEESLTDALSALHLDKTNASALRIKKEISTTTAPATKKQALFNFLSHIDERIENLFA